MAKIVRITRGQLRRAVVSEVQEAKLRGVVRSVLAEAGGRSGKTKQLVHDWDHYVLMTAYDVKSANERGEEVESWEIASNVFRPSDDATVRAMRDDFTGDEPEYLAALKKHAADMGLDEDELNDAFALGLDATEEYMNDEDQEDEDESFTVDVLVDGMAQQDAVTLADLAPFEAEAFRAWVKTQGDGADVPDDEKLFVVHKGSGFIVAFDDETLGSRWGMLLPGLEEWMPYDGDELLPFDEDDEEMTGASKNEAVNGKGRLTEAASDADWNAWLDELYKVLDETGYGGLSDTPAFNNLSSENQAAEDAALDVIRRVRDEGKSQQDVADMLEDESIFWQGVDLDALAAEDDDSGGGGTETCPYCGHEFGADEDDQTTPGRVECPECGGDFDSDSVTEGRLVETPAKKPAVPRTKTVSIVSMSHDGRVHTIGQKSFNIGALFAAEVGDFAAETDAEEHQDAGLIEFEEKLLRGKGVTHVIDFENFGDEEEHTLEEFLALGTEAGPVPAWQKQMDAIKQRRS